MTEPESAVLQRPVVGADGWRLTDEGGYLVAIAGADEIWVIDDVPGTAVAELAACWTDRPPTPDQLSAEALLAVEQLRALGVFGTPNTLPTRPQIAIRWAGTPAAALASTLELLCRHQEWPAPVDAASTGEPADLEIVVRTSATLSATAARTAPLLAAGRLHLLCDLAAAHTVALGPFVVPGHTACIGCLAGRVANRWGDPTPPERPRAAGPAGAGVAAALLIEQIVQAIDNRFSLVDATVSIDLDDLQSQHSPCLRHGRCEHCGGIVTDGRVALPWAR